MNKGTTDVNTITIKYIGLENVFYKLNKKLVRLKSAGNASGGLKFDDLRDSSDDLS